MRVISGKYRGMVLAEFKGKDIRPTADRVKESLFNILFSEVGGARVLDLFCGSGSLGIECLSRGASYVHFNDISSASIAVLKKNLARLNENNLTVTVSDWRDCLLGLRCPFNIIFIDPPYADGSGFKALEMIGKRRLLAGQGVAVYERDRAFSGVVEGLELFDERRYGKTYLSFFKTISGN